jgi:hypothetical protein
MHPQIFRVACLKFPLKRYRILVHSYKDAVLLLVLMNFLSILGRIGVHHHVEEVVPKEKAKIRLPKVAPTGETHRKPLVASLKGILHIKQHLPVVPIDQPVEPQPVVVQVEFVKAIGRDFCGRKQLYESCLRFEILQRFFPGFRNETKRNGTKRKKRIIF